jgi:hypothetical protein
VRRLAMGDVTLERGAEAVGGLHADTTGVGRGANIARAHPCHLALAPGASLPQNQDGSAFGRYGLPLVRLLVCFGLACG